MKPIIAVDNLSKRYVKRSMPAHDTLRDWLADMIRPQQRQDRAKQAERNEFWALKDVSFALDEGDVLGIVGSNGAGKSTLLKILSQITKPTSGQARIRGRVGSLLEVGTGFHPELTGRENIFLNGAILGMRPAEVQSKFDEIVDFSGVEAFIDMPVKRYSSGMRTRLAFSVAAHLEPEVLIVDEVLSVGDSAFRKKCLGKMHDVAHAGRTVLFVSHNLSAIRALCNRAIYLREGELLADSRDVQGVIANYLREQTSERHNEWRAADERDAANQYFRPIHFFVGDADGAVIDRPVASDEDFYVYIEAEVFIAHPNLAIGYSVANDMGEMLYWTYIKDSLEKELNVREGITCIRSKVPKNILNDGDYVFSMIAGVVNEKALLTYSGSPVRFTMEIAGNKSRSSLWQERRQSVLGPVLEWEVRDGR
jgi:lipopolysaccharide transport system ATP-binding protein